MVFDPVTKELNFKDDSLTANMRCAYPMHYISNASEDALGGHPKNIIMLTCDAFGVMPPISRLSPAQAMYHFLSGLQLKLLVQKLELTNHYQVFLLALARHLCLCTQQNTHCCAIVSPHLARPAGW